jgi:hypothetical protein
LIAIERAIKGENIEFSNFRRAQWERYYLL